MQAFWASLYSFYFLSVESPDIMNIKVLVENSVEAKSVSVDAFVVEQSNSGPIQNQKSFGAVVGRQVGAFVPVCSPSVDSQVPETLFRRLACCYENCIVAAVMAGAKNIVVKPLGVGRRINEVFKQGQLVDYDVWGNLFWTQAKTSMAAKLAVQAASSRSDCSGDVNVIFVVPKDSLDDWDSAMRFFPVDE